MTMMIIRTKVRLILEMMAAPITMLLLAPTTLVAVALRLLIVMILTMLLILPMMQIEAMTVRNNIRMLMPMILGPLGSCALGAKALRRHVPWAWCQCLATLCSGRGFSLGLALCRAPLGFALGAWLQCSVCPGAFWPGLLGRPWGIF